MSEIGDEFLRRYLLIYPELRSTPIALAGAPNFLLEHLVQAHFLMMSNNFTDSSLYELNGYDFPPVLAALWMLRSDFQKSFDVSTEMGRESYLQWMNAHVSDLGQSLTSPLRNRSKISQGVNLIGYGNSVLGIGEDARLAAQALEGHLPTHVINLPYHDPKRNISAEERVSAAIDPKYNINIFFLPPIEIYKLYLIHGEGLFRNRRNIGVCQWEFDVWPERYDFCIEKLDEVWSISSFSARAFERFGKQTRVFPQVFDSLAPDQSSLEIRNRFGLPEDVFLILTMFDFNSSLRRKNPSAAIDAFNMAFENIKDVQLIVKTLGGAKLDPEEELFLQKCRSDRRIHLVDQILSRQDVINLIHASDCFLSLHRSEGYGRGMVEARLLGKPVVCTGYSGNMDFSRQLDCVCVPFQLVEVQRNEYSDVAEGLYWAEPDLRAAAKALRRVYRLSRKKPGLFQQSHVDFGSSMHALTFLKEIIARPEKE